MTDGGRKNVRRRGRRLARARRTRLRHRAEPRRPAPGRRRAACQPAQGHARHQDPRRGRGGGTQDVAPEGHRPRAAGLHPAPHWRGGGIVFGPHPRSYHKDLPRKMRRLAMRSALSAKVQRWRARRRRPVHPGGRQDEGNGGGAGRLGRYRQRADRARRGGRARPSARRPTCRRCGRSLPGS